MTRSKRAAIHEYRVTLRIQTRGAGWLLGRMLRDAMADVGGDRVRITGLVVVPVRPRPKGARR